MIYNEEERKLPTVQYYNNKYPYIHHYFRWMTLNVLDAYLYDFQKGAEKHLPFGVYLSNSIVPGEIVMCKEVTTMPQLIGYGVTHHGDVYNCFTAKMYKNEDGRYYRKLCNNSFASRIATVSFSGNSYLSLINLPDIYGKDIILDPYELVFREFFGYQIIERFRDDFNRYLSLAFEDVDDFDYSEVGLYIEPVTRKTYDRLSFFEEPDVE